MGLFETEKLDYSLIFLGKCPDKAGGLKCYNCNESGHLSRDCKVTNGANSKMLCYKCQEIGKYILIISINKIVEFYSVLAKIWHISRFQITCLNDFLIVWGNVIKDL